MNCECGLALSCADAVVDGFLVGRLDPAATSSNDSAAGVVLAGLALLLGAGAILLSRRSRAAAG